MRRELQGSADAAINFRLELLASIVFNNNHGRSLPTLSLYAAKLIMQKIYVYHSYDTECISSFML